MLHACTIYTPQVTLITGGRMFYHKGLPYGLGELLIVVIVSMSLLHVLSSNYTLTWMFLVSLVPPCKGQDRSP